MFKLYDATNVKGAFSELSKTRRVNVYFALFEFIVAISIAMVFESTLETWQQWGIAFCIFVGSVFMIGLIDANIPQGATYLWPKEWRIRNKRIWPRQK